MFQRKHMGPRDQYRDEESQRVNDSPTLASKYPQLKGLTADLHYSDSGKAIPNRSIKYTLNLDASKAVFRFSCPNNECIRGDFDLSDELADAVAGHLTTVSGEKHCRGWLSKTTIDTVRCRHSVRYKLSLAY